MKRIISFILTVLLISFRIINSQDSLLFKGQLSPWINLNTDNKLPLHAGGNYIPQLNYSAGISGNKLFDTELSLNILGNAGLHPFDSVKADGKIKPYRAWVRYSTEQFELRAGLQKINFGSASILRPLMWFDQMDPRDPLHLTDGVWALLARYYFLNNVNIWFWGLFGNHDPRAWELVPTNKQIPEFGGRIQVPVPSGEMAFTYHHRTADNRDMPIFTNYYSKIPEDKFGFDAKWDLIAGLWVEGSWTRKQMNLGTLTNEEILNAGIDYTFGIGNGLYVAYEHLLLSFDQRAFGFANRTSFSLLTASYPVGLFDKLSAMVYYNWTNKTIYNFVTFQKQLDNVIFYLMGFWNPVFFQLPAQSGTMDLFSGKGIQLMFVFNH